MGGERGYFSLYSKSYSPEPAPQIIFSRPLTKKKAMEVLGVGAQRKNVVANERYCWKT